MVKLKLFSLLSLISLSSFAQNTHNPYKDIDAKALNIPAGETGTTKDIANYITAKFNNDSDRVRAIFVWLATNIEYDVANMYALNFYEKRDEKIIKALKTRKGICEHYAAVFNELCQKCGIKSYVIEGYTKQNGFTDYIPHAWGAALIDKNWYLFDPTWGSGYIDNSKFVKKLNNAYYKVPPARIIKSHIPFDPMWEFLNYPVTNQEFYEGEVGENRSKPYFSYTDSIALYEQQDLITRRTAEARRVEGNGVKNSMVYDRMAHIKMDIQEVKVEQYNSAVKDFNEGVNNYNTYIDYWNKQFKPMRPDNEIQTLFDAAYNDIISARNKLNNIKDPDEKIVALMTTLRKSVDDIMVKVEEQQAWLKRYLGKKKVLRPTMFLKIAQ